MPLAGDGVSCTVCHQILPRNLDAASFTGNFEIGRAREIFGPYDDVFTRPMQNDVNYTPKFGAHTQDSALCATCHTLFTPILDAKGRLRDSSRNRFPIWSGATACTPRAVGTVRSATCLESMSRPK